MDLSVLCENGYRHLQGSLLMQAGDLEPMAFISSLLQALCLTNSSSSRPLASALYQLFRFLTHRVTAKFHHHRYLYFFPQHQNHSTLCKIYLSLVKQSLVSSTPPDVETYIGRHGYETNGRQAGVRSKFVRPFHPSLEWRRAWGPSLPSSSNAVTHDI